MHDMTHDLDLSSQTSCCSMYVIFLREAHANPSCSKTEVRRCLNAIVCLFPMLFCFMILFVFLLQSFCLGLLAILPTCLPTYRGLYAIISLLLLLLLHLPTYALKTTHSTSA